MSKRLYIAKIITINPLPEVGLLNYKDPQNPLKWIGKGQELTDLFLQVKINGDVALLKIILKLMKEKEDAVPNSVFLVDLKRESACRVFACPPYHVL